VLILLTPTLKAQTKLELGKSRQDYLAEKIKQNDVCQLDLHDCKETLASTSTSDPLVYFAGGSIAGAVLVFTICALTNGCRGQ
jgi:hypothetical protein